MPTCVSNTGKRRKQSSNKRKYDVVMQASRIAVKLMYDRGSSDKVIEAGKGGPRMLRIINKWLTDYAMGLNGWRDGNGYGNDQDITKQIDGAMQILKATKGLIYLLKHHKDQRVYIGQTHDGDGIVQRLMSHVRDAGEHCRDNSAKRTILYKAFDAFNGDEFRRLTDSRADAAPSGFKALVKGWCVRVLEVVPGQDEWLNRETGVVNHAAFKRHADKLENAWMWRFGTTKGGVDDKWLYNCKFERSTRDDVRAPMIRRLRRYRRQAQFPRNNRHRGSKAAHVANQARQHDISYAWGERAFALAAEWGAGRVAWHLRRPWHLCRIAAYVIKKANMRRFADVMGGVHKVRSFYKDVQYNIRHGVRGGWRMTFEKRNASVRQIRIVIPIIHMCFASWNNRIHAAFRAHVALLPEEYRESIGQPEVFNAYDRPLRMDEISINSAINDINFDSYSQNKAEYVQETKRRCCFCHLFSEKYYGKGSTCVSTMNMEVIDDINALQGHKQISPNLKPTLQKGHKWRPDPVNDNYTAEQYEAALMPGIIEEAMSDARRGCKEILNDHKADGRTSPGWI